MAQETARPLGPTATTTGEGGVVLESHQRLSRSIVWAHHRRYFEEAGVDAFRTDAVPYEVTNHAALADAYAKVLLGYLRDCVSGSPALDPGEPVTVVELGAGSGRFAYLFLKAFTEMARRSSLEGVRVRYVMTDLAATSVRYWRGHPQLRPFVDRGLLDFAVLDAERDGALELCASGEAIGPGALANPIVVIADYVFDCLTQDAFAIRDGALHERVVSATTRAGSGDDARPGLSLSYTEQPAPAGYYGDDDLDGLLRDRAASARAPHFLLPVGAIRCVRRLAGLSGGRLLLLSADYGDDDAGEHGPPAFATYGGSVSLPIDYHAIAAWVTARGGQALVTTHRHAHLAIAAFVLGPGPACETGLAYDQAIAVGGPDDWLSLQLGVSCDAVELETVLAMIRMSRWDPTCVAGCLRALWRCLPVKQEARRRDVVRAIERAYDNYYWMGEPLDVPFELGLVAHAYEGHAQALALFDASVRLYGDDPRTRWNMGLCHAALGQTGDALRCFGDAWRLDPSFRPAGALEVKQPVP